MGIEGISKSQVSRICGELDELVAAWRNRPLDTGPYPLVWMDALSKGPGTGRTPRSCRSVAGSDRR
jgi:transposase-like protein